MNTQRIVVSQQDAGTRLNKLISMQFASFPFSTVAKLSRTGKIRVNGKRISLYTRLEKGDEVRIPVRENTIRRNADNREFSVTEKKIAEDLKDSLVYRDENILVFNKPAGLPVQNGSKVGTSVDSLSSLLKFGAEEKPRLVHRLDKRTSGLLVLARSRSAAQTLSIAFKERIVRKQYIAILEGIPEVKRGVVDTPLKKCRTQGENMEKMHEDSEGKSALTEFKMVDCKKGHSLVEFLLITGRTHQIRAHSASLGCAVLGDSKYSTNKTHISFPLFLHAWKIRIPLFGKVINLTAKLPGYFDATLKNLKMKLSVP